MLSNQHDVYMFVLETTKKDKVRFGMVSTAAKIWTDKKLPSPDNVKQKVITIIGSVC